MYSTYQLSILTDGGIITTRLCGIDDEHTEIISDLWERIQSVENADDLEKAFAAFTDEYAAETEMHLYTHPLPVTDEMAFDIEGEWHADFTVIKNLTDRDFNVINLSGKYKEVALYNGDSLALNLGGFYAGSDEDIARRKMLAELEDLKENLWDNNAGKNYSALWNLCADFDNDQNDDLYLTGIIQEAEFVDEYLLEDYFQNVLAKEPSLSRIKHFLGDTYDDEIYRFDGYGNLANVDKDDFIEVIDSIEDRIIDALVPQQSIRQAQSGSDDNRHSVGGSEM